MNPKIPEKLRPWIEARKNHHLSHANIQMARELGMNPKKFGKIDNHQQERWKLPLPQFIEHFYAKRFGKERPDRVVSIEQRAHEVAQKKAAKKELKRQKQNGIVPPIPVPLFGPAKEVNFSNRSIPTKGANQSTA